MDKLFTLGVVLVASVSYVMIMNWLGGAKYLIGNRIREVIQVFRNLKKTA